MGEYPSQCRKVAIINGANNGTLNPYQGANTSLLEISLKRKGWKSLWGACGDKICKIFDWECKTAPNAGTANVADMWTASPLFNLLFWVPLGKTNYYGAAAWGNSALDNAPGGMFGEVFGTSPGDIKESNFTFLLKESLYLLTGSKRSSFYQNINDFTMMPSYSAADLNFTNKNLYMNWSNEYLCGKTPFDYIYAPTSNQQHVYVSQQNSVWFENEIKCSITDLPVFVGQINGTNSFCSSATYSVETCKPGASIAWSAFPDGIVNLSPNGNQVIVTKIRDGKFTLNATNGSCNSFTVSKNIAVGAPIAPFQIYEDLYDPFMGKLYVHTDTIPGAVAYLWYINGSLKQNSASNYFRTALSQRGCGNYQTLVTLQVTNSCGTSGNSYSTFYPPACIGAIHYIISPNPANSTVTVSSIPNGNGTPKKTLSDEIITFVKWIKIYDGMEKMIKQQQFKGNESLVQSDISDLIPGIYWMEIMSNNLQKETQKLAIQR